MTSSYPTPARIAATLRIIADRLDTVTAPDVYSYVSVALQPHGPGDVDSDEQKIAAIDAIGKAVLGKPGAYSVSTSHHGASGHVDRVGFDVYNSVDSPEKAALKREVAELRRQRDELAAAASGVPVAIPYVPDPDPLPGQHSIPHSVDPYELAAAAVDEVDECANTKGSESGDCDGPAEYASVLRSSARPGKVLAVDGPLCLSHAEYEKTWRESLGGIALVSVERWDTAKELTR